MDTETVGRASVGYRAESEGSPERAADPAARDHRSDPASPSRLLRVFAWISFVLNVVIIGTGGAVRLTGSGLGCPEWPLCAPGSLVPTAELGFHSLIEFGNRTISAPILIAALVVLVLSWRRRSARPQLVVLAAVVLALVVLQAVMGGIIVWLHLNANLVGVHYLVSITIVCVTAAYLARMDEPAGPRADTVPRAFAWLTHLTSLAMGLTVVVGVLTTGAGPHSGDAAIARQGVDATILAHIHAWPGYVLLGLAVVLAVWAGAARLRPRSWSFGLLGVVVVQIAVGVFQSRSGLPPLAVGVHMVLASLAAAAMVLVAHRLRAPAPRHS